MAKYQRESFVAAFNRLVEAVWKEMHESGGQYYWYTDDATFKPSWPCEASTIVTKLEEAGFLDRIRMGHITTPIPDAWRCKTGNNAYVFIVVVPNSFRQWCHQPLQSHQELDRLVELNPVSVRVQVAVNLIKEVADNPVNARRVLRYALKELRQLGSKYGL